MKFPRLSQVSSFRFQVSLLVAVFAATSSPAFLGDTLADITKHRGKPSGRPEPDRAVWLFEGNDGQLAFAVRFDASGRSIAETLKPALIGRTLHKDIVMDFIKAQSASLKDSPTLLTPKVGEKYRFAGQNLTVAEHEFVLVDDPKGFLLVWVRGSLPSVTVIAPAALQ